LTAAVVNALSDGVYKATLVRPGIHRLLSCLQLRTMSMERRLAQPLRSITRSVAATPLLDQHLSAPSDSPQRLVCPATARRTCMHTRTGCEGWLEHARDWHACACAMHACGQPMRPCGQPMRPSVHPMCPCACATQATCPRMHACHGTHLSQGQSREACQRRRGERRQRGGVAQVAQGQVSHGGPTHEGVVHLARWCRPSVSVCRGSHDLDGAVHLRTHGAHAPPRSRHAERPCCCGPAAATAHAATGRGRRARRALTQGPRPQAQPPPQVLLLQQRSQQPSGGRP
jgi:hypothetical protein